jgi:2OG-Fe dioxygenase
VTDFSAHPGAGLDHVWASLAGHGYALTSDQALGLPEKFRENFAQAYFNDSTLRHDEGDWPVDRQRARDVIRYQWRGGQLQMAEHDTITITDRAGIPGKRDHARVRLLHDAEAAALLRKFLEFVPPTRRDADGTFGVNLFRTFTKVVTTPHHDYEKFVIIYVVDRLGDGAETSLYLPDDVPDETQPPAAEPIFRCQLNPGDILIFDDNRFKHDTSPLKAPRDGEARRDALVCTVDDRKTYLALTA